MRTMLLALSAALVLAIGCSESTVSDTAETEALETITGSGKQLVTISVPGMT